ncbi:MAG: gamma-glutamyl-gamma-aminobutyrate hydrolase family protein [Pseudomonadota bacterium]
MKPVIGVTVSQRSGWRIFPLMRLNLWLAGARAVRWQVGGDVDLDQVDGIIIGGGDDIGPALYGAELVMESRLDPERDTLERGIVRNAIDRDMPLLGVCRGSQMLNIALGGTLDQQAYTTFQSREYKTILPRKTVEVDVGTRLASIVGTQPMKVNALHSQSVDTLGNDLRVAARDDGGMIQAIERVCDPFAIGVQWHPEHLFYAHRQRAVFSALVEAARAYRKGQAQTGAVDRACA